MARFDRPPRAAARYTGNLEGQRAIDFAHRANGGDCRLSRFEPVGLDDSPELIERHPVVPPQADVGLEPARATASPTRRPRSSGWRRARRAHTWRSPCRNLQHDAAVLGVRVRRKKQEERENRQWDCAHGFVEHFSMFAGPHPRSLSPFDLAQGDPELVDGSRGDSAPRSGRRRYFRQKKYVKLTPKRSFSSG